MRCFKTIVSVIIVMLMLMPLVSFAAKETQKGIHEPGTGIAEPELKEAGQGTGQGMEAQNQVMLQNQGEEQQNAVQFQQDAQAGQKAMGENAQGNKGQNQASDQAVQRRSRVANAVQEMLKVAERNQGVGQQIKTIAQNQNQNQEEIETTMEQVKNRGRLKKFFFGPDYKNINSVEDRLANHEEKLEQLKQLALQITNAADVATLQGQIEVMEQIGVELENEITEESKGFSLFGWLNKMISK